MIVSVLVLHPGDVDEPGQLAPRQDSSDATALRYAGKTES